jgi:two-component system nitrogen regulation response regulator NtrX
VTERALILSNDEKKLLGVESLTPEVQGVLPKRVHDQEKSQDILSLSIKQAREFFEKEYLLAQVSRFGGNISRTAEFIGMERSALHRKLRLLQVDPAHRKAG